MKPSIGLHQSQQQTLSPQQRQSLKLLQLTGPELEQAIESAIESNSLLERAQKERADEVPMATPESQSTVTQDEAAESHTDHERQDNIAAESELTSILIGVAADSDFPHSAKLSASNKSQNAEPFLLKSSAEKSLTEHLIWQIGVNNWSDNERLIGHVIAHSLDDEGYLRAPTSELLNIFDAKSELSIDDFEHVLTKVQGLDPVGVAASNLPQRLKLLLEFQAPDSEAKRLALRILDQHIDLLAKRNLSALGKALNEDSLLINDAVSLIKELDPRITSGFSSLDDQYIQPDLLVQRANDRWEVKINPDNECKLQINQSYANMLKLNLDDVDKEYIQNDLLQAKGFIKGLMSRYDTLLLVGQQIVEKQQAFFKYGASQMQPLTLSEVGQALSLHESTISRASSGKYLQCPRGVFELKYFFSSAIAADNGGSFSSTAIRDLIQQIVANESKFKPLSDSKIVAQLQTQGFRVARRTVAKYRESLNIAPASQRKRFS